MRVLVLQSQKAMPICYLVRHVAAGRDLRMPRLVGLLREKWEYLNATEQAWLFDYWQPVAPGGPDIPEIEDPDGEHFAMWARMPLLERLD